MNFFNAKHVVAAAMIGLAFGGGISMAQAGIDDYEFQLVQSAIKKGDGAIVAVRLVDKRSGKVVEMMTSPIEPLPSTEPGIYRFKANLMMPGGYRLSIGAKVQGETGSLENKLEFKATP